MEELTDDQKKHMRGIIEALLFVNERPVTLEQIKKVIETVNAVEIKNIVQELSGEYEQNKKGIRIVEIAGGYQMLSNPLYVNYIREFYKKRHKEKLSKPALEAVAIIAYKQPVTRGDIELIRGVNSDGVVSHLLNKELIKVVGRKDVPGKPFLYGTTKIFLEYFGLKSLEDLPKLEEFDQLEQASDDEPSEEMEGEGQDISDESIPDSAIPMNSLEQARQSAISDGMLDNPSPSVEEIEKEEAEAATAAAGQNEESGKQKDNEPN